MLKLCVYVSCIVLLSVVVCTLCVTHLCDWQKLASADVWGVLYKSLKHSHKKTHNGDEVVSVNKP